MSGATTSPSPVEVRQEASYNTWTSLVGNNQLVNVSENTQWLIVLQRNLGCSQNNTGNAVKKREDTAVWLKLTVHSHTSAGKIKILRALKKHLKIRKLDEESKF